MANATNQKEIKESVDKLHVAISVTDNLMVNGLILKSDDLMPVEVNQEQFQKLLYVCNVKKYHKNNNEYFDFMVVFLHLRAFKKSNILELKKSVEEV